MNKGEFVKQVQVQTGIDSKDKAEEATKVVLKLLSNRLTPDESRDVEAQLSQDMKELWRSENWLQHIVKIFRKGQLKYRHKAELYEMIRKELGDLGLEVSEEHLTLAVFHVLKEQISEGEAEDVEAQLPKEIKDIWYAA